MKHILKLAALGFATSCFGQDDCPNMYDGNGNGTIDIEDFLGVLSLFGDVDVDSDGLWDSVDGCTDNLACNYMDGAAEFCSYANSLGDCSIVCPFDSDGDGFCDLDCGYSVTYQGYDYATVLIGGQCWFAENLRSAPNTQMAKAFQAWENTHGTTRRVGQFIMDQVQLTAIRKMNGVF